MQHQTNEADASGTGRRLRSGLLAAGAAVAMTVAGLGVAQAQIDTPEDPPPTKGAAVEATPAPGAAAGMKSFGRHRGGHDRLGMGIRAEVVVRKPGGGFQTVAHHAGEVTAVTRDSIALKSEDGFSRTYAVNDDTLVKAGNDGIGDVKVGDQVRLTAIVEGESARAVDVRDTTRIRESRERWMPRPERAPAPAQGATGD